MANFLDAVAQRQFVASVFVLLQGIKLYELINNSGFGHISWLYKWSLIDMCFLAFVSWCKIPRLEKISLWRWLLVAFLLSALNLTGLSLKLERFPISVHLSIGGSRDIAAAAGLLGMLSMGRTRNNMSSHLQGAVKVNIVPWSTIVLNPQSLPVCLFHISDNFPGSELLSPGQVTPWLDLDMNAPVSCIPISVQGDGPWKIKLKISGEESNELKTLDLPLDMKCLKVSSPGFYEIMEIVDKNGNLGRVRATDPFHVIHCPELRIDPEILNRGIDVCRGRVETESVPFLSLWAKGKSLLFGVF